MTTATADRIGRLECGCVCVIDQDGEPMQVLRPCASYPDDCPTDEALMVSVALGVEQGRKERLARLARQRLRYARRKALEG